MKFKRILLKLSGEALMGEQKGGIDPAVVSMIADQVKTISEMACRWAWSSAAAHLPGGGRRHQGHGSHHRGSHGHARHHDQCPGPPGRPGAQRRGDAHPVGLEMPKVTETYIRRRATRHLEKGRVVISVRAPATPTSAPIPRRRCAPTRSTPKW